MVLPEQVYGPWVQTVLALPHVAGLVIADQRSAETVKDPRVGYMHVDGSWSLPAIRCKSIFTLSRPKHVNLKRTLSAIPLGARWLLWVDYQLCIQAVHLTAWARKRVAKLANRYLVAGWRTSAVIGSSLKPQQISQLLRRVKTLDEYQPKSHTVMMTNSSLSAGGAERQMIHTANGMAAHGKIVDIRCFNVETLESDFYLDHVSDACSVGRFLQRDELLQRSGGDLKAMRAQLEQYGFGRFEELLPDLLLDDIVLNVINILHVRPRLVHFWQDHPSITGGIAAVLVGVPDIILGLRTMAPYNFFYYAPYMRPIYQALAACENVRFVNNSHAGARDYAQWMGVPVDRITVVHNAVTQLKSPQTDELEVWKKEHTLAKADLIVGGVFRFSPEKDPILWLDVARSVSKRFPNAHFILAGDGNMKHKMVRYVERIGLQDRVHFLGIVENIRLPMAAMDVLLLTSHQEGLPNVLIEAQSIGTPVISTEAGGARETMENGKTGWIVESRRVEEISNKVIEVLDNPAWRAEASVNSRAYVSAKFGMSLMLERTAAVYGAEFL